MKKGIKKLIITALVTGLIAAGHVLPVLALSGSGPL